MSNNSSDPENLHRELDTSSSASVSTVSSHASKTKKKPWSKFKSSIKSIGEKMSSKPRFTESSEGGEQKRVKKSKKKGNPSNVDVTPGTFEDKQSERSPKDSKSLVKRLSVESLGTPFVGHQPSSVSSTKSYARALHTSGSTSESNLSASDIDTPSKSLTLDKNTKFSLPVQDSPDSGRGQTMESSGSLGGSRPPSQANEEVPVFKEATSDLSVDSDYTSPRRSASKSVTEEAALDSLVAKTEHFAQSLVSPKPEKEKDFSVSVEFIKAESTEKTPTVQPITTSKTENISKSETKIKKRPETYLQDNKNDEIEKPSDSSGKSTSVEVREDLTKSEVDGRKKRDKGSRSSKIDDNTTADFIKSEQSKSGKTESTNLSDITSVKDEEKSSPEPTVENKKEPSPEPKLENIKEPSPKPKVENKKQPMPEERSEQNKETFSVTKPVKSEEPVSVKKSEEEKEKLIPSTTSTKVEEKTATEEKPIKVNEEAVSELKLEENDKNDKSTPEATTNDEKENIKPISVDTSTEFPEKDKPKTSTPTQDSPWKSAPETLDLTSPQPGETSPSPETKTLSVEEKLEAFLAAEGWSGTIKDIPVKSGEDMNQQADKRECLYKILVIGELGTGKTSIIKRYVHQFFSQHYRATIGVDFALKVLNWDPNTIIRLQLWDIAGQERFGNMTRVYYKEAVGAFIVFDVTRSATFDAVLKWKQDLDSKVQLADGSPIPCVLLANKCDQQKEGIVNTPAKMEEYCKENNFSAWFETSAKENINIDEAAKSLVTQILQNDKMNQNGRDSARDPSKFPLNGKSEEEGRSCAC